LGLLIRLGYAFIVPQQLLMGQLQLIHAHHLIATVGYLLIHSSQHLTAELFAFGFVCECGLLAHYVFAFALKTDQDHQYDFHQVFRTYAGSSSMVLLAVQTLL
jgi:hypothetical protein